MISIFYLFILLSSLPLSPSIPDGISRTKTKSISKINSFSFCICLCGCFGKKYQAYYFNRSSIYMMLEHSHLKARRNFWQSTHAITCSVPKNTNLKSKNLFFHCKTTTVKILRQCLSLPPCFLSASHHSMLPESY